MIATLALACALLNPAQDPMAVPPVPKELDRIKFMLGTWKGKGTMTGPDGKSMPVTGGGTCKMAMDRWVSWDGDYVMPGQAKMSGRMMATYNNYTGKFEGEWFDNLTPYALHLTGYTEGKYLVFMSQDIPDGNGGSMKFKITYVNESPKKVGLTVKMAVGGNYMTVVTFTYDKK